MLTEHEVRTRFNSIGISVYETHYNFDSEVDVRLLSDDIEELCSLVVENQLKSVFFSSIIAEEDDYLISEYDMLQEDECEKYGIDFDRFKEAFDAKKNEYNNKIDRNKLNKPMMICVYCLLGATQVGVVQSDPDLLVLPDKGNAIETLVEELIEEKRSLNERNLSESRKIQNKIYKDVLEAFDRSNEWHHCTNQRLRRNYCLEIIEKCKSENGYDGVFVGSSRLVDELELRWNKYKKERSAGNN